MRKVVLWAIGMMLTAGMGYSATIYSENFDSTSTSAGVYTWTRSSTTYVIRTTTYKVGVASMRTAYGANAYKTVNTVGFTGISVTFKLAGYGLDSGESVVFQYRTSSSATWVTIGTLADGADTGAFKSYSYTLPTAAANNAALQFRFLNKANATADYGYLDDVVVSGTPVKSTKSGMGAIAFTGGTTFRVWAPNATTVSVAGSFNSWSATATPLVSEGNGYWSRDVPSVAAGATYQYVINGTMWRKDPYARKQVNSSGNSVVYAPSGATTFTPPAYESQIIYQLHVGSFGASSTAVGKFANVQSKISYIKSLGVNMVEFLPVLEYPMDDSWGYNQSDMFAPESYYGGPEALITLVNAFHAQGIGVIFDLVINHMGNGDNQLWQFDGWSQNGLGGIYFYNDAWKAETPWGSTRFDYGRAEVRSFLKDQSVYFVEKYQADGLRYDATSFIRYYKDAYFNNHGANPEGLSLLQWINSEVHLKKPSAITIAEDMDNDTSVTRPSSSGGAGFNSQWNVFFASTLRNECMQGSDANRNMYNVQNALNWYGGATYNQVNYVESHDEVGGPPDQSPLKTRLCKHIDWNNPHSYYAKKRSTLGGALAILSRGIPMMFQGQEFMEDKRFQCMVANESIANMPTWSYQTTYSGILQMYKDLITLKKNYASLRSSTMNVFHVDNTSKLVAFYRYSGTQKMVIIANFANTTWTGNYTIGWPANATGHCVFNSDWNGYSSDFGNYGGYTITPSSGSYDGFSYKANINIAPYSILVYDIY